MNKRSLLGQQAYLSGCQAETSARAVYIADGAKILEERWHGESGEIDLIIKDRDEYVFAEVKRAQTLDVANQRLSPRQIRRIVDAASEYLEKTPCGQLTPVRFDLVLVDAMGQVSVQRGAFGNF